MQAHAFPPHRRASATAEYGHISSMVSERLLPASGVTSLFSFSLSFGSLFTKGVVDWREAGSLIAVRCPIPPHGHYWSFHRFFSLLSGGCTRLSTELLEASSFPKHFTLAGQKQAFFEQHTGSPRQSKAEWSNRMDFQGAELTQLAVHHTKNLLQSADLNKGLCDLCH